MKNNKALSRVPQSLSFDNKALNRTYGEEAAIIRDIIVYVANNQMINLFGEVEFSISEFCDVMGYNRTTLARTLEKFREGDAPQIDEHKFDSTFEYALFRGLKENVVFKRKRDGKETFESVQIIEKLDVLYDKTTRKLNKRIYNIRLGSKILDYLFTEYNLIDFNEYRNIRSQQISVTGSLRNFYIFMARVITQVKYNKKIGAGDSFIISIDDLCGIYGVEIETAKDKKKYITRILNNMNKELSNLKYDWQYVKNGYRYAYFVEFKFTDKTLEYFDEQLKSVFFKQLYGNLKYIFLHAGKDASIENYKNMSEKYANMDREKYMEWFFSDDEDKAEKLKAFHDTYLKVYGCHYNEENNFLF